MSGKIKRQEEKLIDLRLLIFKLYGHPKTGIIIIEVS
jgi:hypothetical protein